MCAFLDNRLGIAPARKMNIKPIPSLLYLPHIYQTSPGRNIPSEPYFITPHMSSMATLNFVGTRLPLHLTQTYPLSLLNNCLTVYPLLPCWIVFVLYLPPPSQFQPTVRQIGADKGFLLQTWLLWKHHPLLGSEWSNFKKISLTCLTFVSIKDTCT